MKPIQPPRYKGDSRSIIVNIAEGVDPTDYTWTLTAQTNTVVTDGGVLFTINGTTSAGSQLVTFAMSTANANTMTAGGNVIYEISAISGGQVVSRQQTTQMILASEVTVI